MQNLINTKNTDLLSLLGSNIVAGKLAESTEGFKGLLDVAMQGGGKPGPKTDKVDEAAAADAVAAAAAPQPQPQQETAEAGAAEAAAAEAASGTGQTTLAAVAQMAAVLDTQPQADTGDILSMELTVSGDETEILAGETQLPATLVVDSAAADDRFSQMLDQAQQQLQQAGGAGEEAAAPETEAPQTTPVAEAPADVEIPADEAPADEPQVQAQAQTETADRSTTPRTDQKPLREMPQTDRTILEMESPRAEQAAVDTGVRERGVEPRPLETAPTQPQQPAYQTEQSEQIRVQVTESLQRGDMEFRMQLSPAELGDIEVKMVLEGGRLAIEILAASQRTSALLQRQIDALTASLRVHANQEVTSVQVVSETSTASGHMSGAFNMDTQAEQGAFGRGQSGGRPGATGEGPDDDRQPAQEAVLEPERLLNYTI